MTKDEALKMAIKTAKTAIKEWQKLVDDLDGKAWRKINELEEKLEDCKEALEQPTMTYEDGFAHGYEAHRAEQALALSEKQHTFPDKKQPAQKPVAWMNDIAFSMDKELLGTRSRIVPLYTHPAPSWQGLSDDEIQEELKKMWDKGLIPSYSIVAFARAIEQALKEKNNV